MIEEQNDALKRNIKTALDRYKFAIKCLKGRRLDIIDLGCGMGYGSYMLYLEGHNVIGMDNSDKAIQYARDNYERYDSRCEFYKGDLNVNYSMTSPVAVCMEVLCHLNDPQAFINKINSEELIISAPIDPDPDDGYIYRLHNLSEKQFKELLKNWQIVNEFKQKKYLTIYAIKK